MPDGALRSKQDNIFEQISHAVSRLNEANGRLGLLMSKLIDRSAESEPVPMGKFKEDGEMNLKNALDWFILSAHEVSNQINYRVTTIERVLIERFNDSGLTLKPDKCGGSTGVANEQ